MTPGEGEAIQARHDRDSRPHPAHESWVGTWEGQLHADRAALLAHAREHEKCAEEWEANLLTMANRENELHAEKDAKIARLEALVRELRGALENLTDDYDRILAHFLFKIGSNMVTEERVRKLTEARQALALAPDATPEGEGG